MLLAVGRGLGRPEPPLTGFGGLGGGYSPNIQLDSYAAPVGGNAGGSYPSGGPPPQYGPPQQAPVIHKHVYVHVPPPEPTYYAPKKPQQPPPPPQKHYKIVFIKAPTPPTPTVPDIPAIAPPAEQKTLIYVLVKKPEEAPEIHIPTPAPTQPSKPEVYFIRYKTQVSTRCYSMISITNYVINRCLLSGRVGEYDNKKKNHLITANERRRLTSFGSRLISAI